MIAAYMGRSLPSRIIRLVNWSDYSHVSWIDPDGLEFEAWRKGVTQGKPFSNHTPGTRVDLFDVELSQHETAGLRAFFTAQIGKRYDFIGCLHFLTRRPQGRFGEDRWFCSELVSAAFQSIGKALLERIPPYKVYPGMLVTSPLITLAGGWTVDPDRDSSFLDIIQALRTGRSRIAQEPRGRSGGIETGGRASASVCKGFSSVCKGVPVPEETVEGAEDGI